MLRLSLRVAPLLALAAALLLPFAGAQAAADLTYSVSGIHVDATAPSATAAEAVAIDQGRPRAWDILVRRIVKPGDLGRVPKLDLAGLKKVIRGYTTTHEKRSTTRFVADVTYTFSQQAVSRLLSSVVSSSYRIVNAQRILLIPMAPRFDTKSGWSSAFSSPRFASSAVPFAVPTGTASDVVALSNLDFDSATWKDVQLVAARIHASEAVLALAIPLTKGGTSMTDQMTGKVQVWLKRIGAAETPMKTSVDVPLIKNVVQTYPLAADAAVRGIEELFRQRAPMGFGGKGTLTADVHIDSIQQWGTIQNAMAITPNVVSTQVNAMDIGLVRISVT
ncbi:MAG: hypothetical protein JO348_01005, partial [Alphaproteobacteria bacterium]|nr:hypothetical protein [Alphaproteobacteria bacterium]